MRRLFPFLVTGFVVTVLSGCAAESMSRGVYEGSRAYDKALKSTPMEKSKDELPTYDQYEKERRGDAK